MKSNTVINYSDIINVVGKLSVTINEDKRNLVEFDTCGRDFSSQYAKNEKTAFATKLCKTIKFNVESIVKSNYRHFIKDYKDILNSVSKSYWERIRYENVNFFYSDIKTEIYETSISMFVKNVFKHLDIQQISAPESWYYKVYKSLKNIPDRIYIRHTFNEAPQKKKSVVFTLHEMLGHHSPNACTMSLEQDDDLFQFHYPPIVFIEKITNYLFYLELVDLVCDYFIYGKHKAYYKDIPDLFNILIRNETYMEGFAVEYNKFANRVSDLLKPVYIERNEFRSEMAKDPICYSIATNVAKIILKQSSVETEMISCMHVDHICKLIQEVKNMSSPNMDPRCDTYLEGTDDLDRLNTFRILDLFKEKTKAFEAYAEEGTKDLDFSHNPKVMEYITSDKNDLDDEKLITFVDTIKEAIWKYIESYTKDVKKIALWLDDKINSKISYGFKYDSEEEFRNYVKYLSMHETGFDKFSNPAIAKLF